LENEKKSGKADKSVDFKLQKRKLRAQWVF
jgi:hypothetical protein